MSESQRDWGELPGEDLTTSAIPEAAGWRTRSPSAGTAAIASPRRWVEARIDEQDRAQAPVHPGEPHLRPPADAPVQAPDPGDARAPPENAGARIDACSGGPFARGDRKGP